ncbi:MAG: ubiquinol-cytochrome c reductase iron-sulfur subunit [Anaerolineales bacterium]|nr:ubiquinol-cytochrome c reductase iron-sulfur subunit [Anaerolineales bacterium]
MAGSHHGSAVGYHHISRRDFIKLTTVALGSLMGAVIGLPAIGYLVDPALKAGGKEAWIPLGPLEKFEVGKPTPVTFIRSKVNGWEKTANSYGVFVLRKSDAPTDVMVLSNRCTHLSCRVNWKEEQQAYLCPCHDAAFDINGAVLGGPPPRPLDKYAGENLKVEDGVVHIFFAEG